MSYERLENINPNDSDKFLQATTTLLCSLFSDLKYSNEEKLLYGYICRNSIEDFINGEIFSEGAIRIFPLKNIGIDKKVFYQLCLTYLLHCRLNFKLERCQPELYNFKTFDSYLYDILCYSAWKNCSQWEDRDKTLCSKKNFFDNFCKTSFHFNLNIPYGIQAEYVWCGSKYSSASNDCQQFEIETDFDYGSYMRFLLSENGNPIRVNFGNSTRRFWDDFIKLGRSNSPYRLEDGCTADIDLTIFCIALCLDEKNLNRLKLLRSKAYPSKTPIRPSIPRFANPTEEKDVNEKLTNLLKFSRQKLEETIANQQIRKTIPRIMLSKANAHLKEKGFDTYRLGFSIWCRD